MFEPPQVAERIKVVVKSKKIGTLEMLEACGLSKNALTTMVNGSMPKANSLGRIAKALNVSVDYLLGLTDDPSLPENPVPYVSPDEYAHIVKLRALTPEKRKAIELLLE